MPKKLNGAFAQKLRAWAGRVQLKLALGTWPRTVAFNTTEFCTTFLTENPAFMNQVHEYNVIQRDLVSLITIAHVVQSPLMFSGFAGIVSSPRSI